MCDPESEYLFHFTQATTKNELIRAEQITKTIHNLLEEEQFHRDLSSVGGDIQKVSTGFKNGMMKKLETYLQNDF